MCRIGEDVFTGLDDWDRYAKADRERRQNHSDYTIRMMIRYAPA